MGRDGTLGWSEILGWDGVRWDGMGGGSGSALGCGVLWDPLCCDVPRWEEGSAPGRWPCTGR